MGSKCITYELSLLISPADSRPRILTISAGTSAETRDRFCPEAAVTLKLPGLDRCVSMKFRATGC
jgi:hypothetical protein